MESQTVRHRIVSSKNNTKNKQTVSDQKEFHSSNKEINATDSRLYTGLKFKQEGKRRSYSSANSKGKRAHATAARSAIYVEPTVYEQMPMK